MKVRKSILYCFLATLLVAGLAYAETVGFGPWDYTNNKEYWSFVDGDIVPGTDNNVDVGASGTEVKMLYTEAVTTASMTLNGVTRTSWGASTLDSAYDAGTTIDLDADGDIEMDLTVTARKVQIANTFAGAQAIALEIDAEVAQAITDGLLFNCTAGTIVDAVDAKHASITNAINVGANVIYGTGGASINFDEFDVSGSTGSITIADGGGSGSITIDSTVLDKSKLDFVGNGYIDNADDGTLTLGVAGGNAAGEDLIITAHNIQLTATGCVTLSPDAGVTTALTITDTDYTNALSVGTNNIIGTTGTIDYDAFDVDAAGAVVCTALDAGSGTITTSGDLNVGTVIESAVQPSSGDLTLDGATGENKVIIGSQSTDGITVSDNVDFGVTSLFVAGAGLGFRGAEEAIHSSAGDQLDIDATVEVEIATATLDANLSAALAVDAVTASNITVSAGDLTIQASDSGNAASFDVIIEAGNAVTSAGEDGNDIALEAEDDILLEAKDDVDVDAAGDFLVDAGAAISLDAGAGVSNFTATGGDLTLAATDKSVNINATEAGQTDQIKLHAIGAHTGIVLNLTTTSGQIGIDANNSTNGDIVLDAEDDITIDAADIVSIDGGEASNFTTSAGDLTLQATAASVNINASEASADQIKLNAQGTIDGAAINLTTTRGGITIDANHADDGDIIIDAEATLDVNTVGAITVNIADENTADATDIPDITITAGSKTGGGATGAGGDIILVAGDSDSGVQGYIKISDDVLVATTEKIHFRDPEIFINSPSDGKLEIEANAAGADDILLDGGVTIDGSHNLTVGGNIIGDGASELTGMVADLVEATAKTIANTESGTVFYNSGAIEMELPEAGANLGVYYTFVVLNASNFHIDPDDADIIVGLTDAAGNRIKSSAVGDSVTLLAVSASQWVVTGCSNATNSADAWIDDN